MTPRIQASRGSGSPERHVENLPIDLSHTNVLLVCNDDQQLAEQIASKLRNFGANSVRLSDQYVGETWETQVHFEKEVSGAMIVISLLYNNYEKQEMLVNACIQKEVALFISWDAGMELEKYVSDKTCPRTRLHKYLRSISKNENQPDPMRWILFQVGIFSDEVLKHDMSTITTAFNSPKQYIFINITVKEDLAHLVAESIVSREIQLDRNYVVGDFVSHTFLGHVYQVVHNGVPLNINLPADITEFEINNQLRLSGIVSARPLPRILYPGCSIFFHKLGIEISFQHDAAIYKILKYHHRTSLKEWIYNKISSHDRILSPSSSESTLSSEL